jgi:hypothetical protein
MIARVASRTMLTVGSYAATVSRTRGVLHSTGHHLINGQHPRSSRAPRCGQTVRIHDRIEIELHMTLSRRVLEYQVDIGGMMYPLQVDRVSERRFKLAQGRPEKGPSAYARLPSSGGLDSRDALHPSRAAGNRHA